MTRYETIDTLVDEFFKDKEVIKENLKKITDNCTIECEGYRLKIELEVL